MRLIKTLGLAAIAALAAMAFVGVGTASADSLCLVNSGHNGTCASPLAEGTLVKGNTSSAVLLDEDKSVVMTCASNVLGKVGKNEGSHVGRLGTISELEFTNCSGLCADATGTGEPYTMLVNALALEAHVEEGGGGTPGATLTGCGFFFTCKYELEEGLAVLGVSGDTLVASNEPLVETSGSGACPDAGFWDATYLVTTDNKANSPVYATSLP